MLFKKPLFGILALVSVLLCIWSLPSAYGYYEGSNNGGGQKVWTFDPGSWTAGTP